MDIKFFKIKEYIFIGTIFTGNFILTNVLLLVLNRALIVVRKIPSKFRNRILARPWIGDVQISNYTFVCSGPEFPHPGRRYLCCNSSRNCAQTVHAIWDVFGEITRRRTSCYKLQCIHRWKCFDIFLSNIRSIHVDIRRLIFNYHII